MNLFAIYEVFFQGPFQGSDPSQGCADNFNWPEFCRSLEFWDYTNSLCTKVNIHVTLNSNSLLLTQILWSVFGLLAFRCELRNLIIIEYILLYTHIYVM